ncbi:MAG: hypothetical protein H7145_23240 [Akkermansiaceae bacterium]|nr:hypothetical protein [Armatimonadota bacterium]
MFASLTGSSRQQQDRDRALASGVLESMESQLIALYTEKELLQRKVGVSTADDIIVLITALEERVRRHEPGFDFRKEMDGEPDSEPAPSTEAEVAGDGFKDLSHRIRVLTGTVNSMEAQLIDVYADRELLYREGGIKQTQDVLARLRENEKLRAQVAVMEDQLAALYAQRHTLKQGLGVTDAGEVVARIQSVNAALEAAQHSLRYLLPAAETAPEIVATPDATIKTGAATETDTIAQMKSDEEMAA